MAVTSDRFICLILSGMSPLNSVAPAPFVRSAASHLPVNRSGYVHGSHTSSQKESEGLGTLSRIARIGIGRLGRGSGEIWGCHHPIKHNPVKHVSESNFDRACLFPQGHFNTLDELLQTNMPASGAQPSGRHINSACAWFST